MLAQDPAWPQSGPATWELVLKEQLQVFKSPAPAPLDPRKGKAEEATGGGHQTQVNNTF